MLALLLALALQGKPVAPKDESAFVKVAEEAKLPHLAFDSDGNAYVTFVRKGNIELAISTDGGKTFGAPVVVLNSGGKDGGILNRGSRVCIDRNKRVWVSGPLAPPNGPVVQDLYFAVSTDRGKTFSKPYMINEGTGTASHCVHSAAAGPG